MRNRLSDGSILVITLVAAGCDVIGGSAPATTISPGTVEPNAMVEFVIDGDTIDAIIDGPGGPTEERIRLIGIDTPETKKPDEPVECFGPEATTFVEELLPVGTPIRIERDIVSRDDFGRILGYVFRAEDGIFVNYEVIRQGYGTPLSIEPNTTYRELMVDAATAAEVDDVGLWAACGS